MNQAFLTVDLGFGDAGKGAVVDFLTRQFSAHTVVRYNGGAQAGHRVVAPGNREHVFSQFGSGTLAGAATHLSRFMLLEPMAMLEEARHLRALGAGEPFERTTVDAGALVITPFARAINRLSELARGNARHGSCGMGVGETMIDFLALGERALFAGDLADRDRLHAKLGTLREANRAKLARLTLPDTPEVAAERAPLDDPDWADWLLDDYAVWAEQARIVPGEFLHTILRRPGAVVFEAAQGVLLDEWRGFHPHTTWSTTTLANADRLLGEAGYSGAVTRVGITRAYATRHGAGPLPTEDPALAAALPDARNSFGAWQQGFRVGWLDTVLLRYALDTVGPLDTLALTCLDRLEALPEAQICRRYHDGAATVERLVPGPAEPSLEYQETLTQQLFRCRPQLEQIDISKMPALLFAETGVPVGILSRGAGPAAKQIVPGAGL
jgi:adenylosuccinate synthase